MELKMKKKNRKQSLKNQLKNLLTEGSKKFEITTLTSLPKLDPVKQSKYDQMLSQLSSDVITPPPMKPKVPGKSKDYNTRINTKQYSSSELKKNQKSGLEEIVKPVSK